MKFEDSLAVVLRWEGGYSDHADDPGGATNLGITRKTLSAYRGRKVTKDEVRALTHEEAEQIYRVLYWEACRCDELPAAARLAVFDCAVNQGVGRASRLLQKAAGAKVDGKIGPRTLARVRAKAPHDLVRDFMARRAVHYASLLKMVRFHFGWFRRLFDIHRRTYE